MLIEYYKHQQSANLDSYFYEIEEWLNRVPASEEANQPLVIDCEDDTLTKVLLVKWLEFHGRRQGSNSRDIVITHFASAGGNNTNYFYTIYRILIKLRVAPCNEGRVQH